MTRWRLPVALLLVLACLVLAAQASAVRNPFLSSSQESGESAPAGVRGEESSSPSILSGLLRTTSAMQRELRLSMVRAAGSIRENPWGGAFWAFMGLAFLYGVVHAVGPGHGKTITATYFLGRPGGVASGIAFGNLTMLTHVVSASVLVLGGAELLGLAGGQAVEEGGLFLEKISYGLILAVGLGLFLRGLLEYRRGGPLHHHDHPPRSGRGGLVLTAAAAGLVPCPGAALILLFAVSHQLVRTGLLAMASVSLGMGLTTSAFALLAIGSRGALLRLARRREKAFARLHAALTLGGALAVAVLGGLLLASVT
ncbi:nickel/cobalt transporter [Desulfohalovibrio reitneri]|uniref:nickel/cobalt transporter n=1 Tax=Desulfohalovibrio reitneri TaxID=1307759 RepID=UPI00068ED09B|nr:hypothetical protein [Desulfohalovibrio reitneri]